MPEKKIYEAKIHSGQSETCQFCNNPIVNGNKCVEITEDRTSLGKLLKAGKYHFFCLAKKKYFIVFLDMLGFNQFCLHSTIKEMRLKIEDLFEVASASKVRGRVGSRSFPLSDIPYFVISDSIIVYKEVCFSDSSDELVLKEEAFGELLIGLEELYKKAFKKNIYLRGGISYGEVIIALDTDYKENMIVGKPYIQAVKVEKIQTWMGIAFHPSMIEYLKTSRYKHMLAEYKIPIKKNCKKRKIPDFTIKWVDITIRNT